MVMWESENTSVGSMGDEEGVAGEKGVGGDIGVERRGCGQQGACMVGGCTVEGCTAEGVYGRGVYGRVCVHGRGCGRVWTAEVWQGVWQGVWQEGGEKLVGVRSQMPPTLN
ncbi:hypothetical protein Pmani_033799 [Petrolisthes manimaculis]|uniref:Uncharacterized protein n=1 Tax=Petrolisthes manimaculis TaxID=1843537 RepID=A0AAE1NNP6_9EUCA|nr:hypothetical protein Pmani_033799 [Petrolisthes manimaculis]